MVPAMTFAAVTWAYKDVITSAKLAQMVENIRTHDHLTTDQGGQFGALVETAYNPTGQVVNTTAVTAVTGAAPSFTITSNGATARKIYYLLPVIVAINAAATLATLSALMSGTGFTAITGAAVVSPPVANVGQSVMAVFRATCPPAGTYTITTSVQFSVAGANNKIVSVGPGAVVLL